MFRACFHYSNSNQSLNPSMGAVASSGTPVKSERTALICWDPKGLKWNENRPYTEEARQASA